MSERLSPAEEEKAVNELKKKTQAWVEELKKTKGVRLEEEIAFVAPQFKSEDGEGFIRWLEATCGPHLVLESFPQIDSYAIGLVGLFEEEKYARRIVIREKNVTYEEGFYNNTGKFFPESKPSCVLPPGILAEINSLLP